MRASQHGASRSARSALQVGLANVADRRTGDACDPRSMRLGHFILSFVIVATAAQAVPTYAPAEAVPGQPTAWAKSMIDVFSASDEIAMVRFRLQLHEPLAFKTIVLESNYTHTGRPKPLYIANALSAEEKARYNVHVINVPFGDALLRKANCSLRRCVLALEDAQRSYVNSMLLAERLEHIRAGRRELLVHLSDVDELLDPDAILGRSMPGCHTPVLRMMVYGERCWTSEGWGRSIIFNATSEWFPDRLKRFPSLQLRAKDRMRQACPRLRGLSGWHMTYFMDTAHLLEKLRTFSHSMEAFVRAITQAKDPSAAMEKRVRTCTSVHGRAYGARVASYDGKLPQVEGWPRHVLAPRASSIPAEQLLAENTTHAAAVLAEEAKAATAATAPSSDHQWLVESSLRKARGRLAATMAELRLRGLPD